jgi:hypothetical protein
MSPRERNIWIRFASILIVFIPYFLHVVSLFRSDGPISRALCIAFLGATLALALLNGLGQLAALLIFGKEVTDERDGAMVLTGFSTLAFLGAITPASPTGTILRPTYATTSQFVFFSIVAAEAVRYLVQLFCYRREALA